MVGFVHELLFRLVESTATSTAVREIKRRAGVSADQEFRMDQVYDDAQWRRLMAATCDVLQFTQHQAELAFADFFFNDVRQHWPMWFRMSKHSREFLEPQPAIHNGFATGVQDPQARRTINEKFQLQTRGKQLIVSYRSPNRLCGFYKALARKIITHYGDDATVDETRCLKNGDSSCEIRISWA